MARIDKYDFEYDMLPDNHFRIRVGNGRQAVIEMNPGWRWQDLERQLVKRARELGVRQRPDPSGTEPVLSDPRDEVPPELDESRGIP